MFSIDGLGGIRISNALFRDSSIYLPTVQRSRKRQYAETPPLSRYRQHYFEVNRLFLASSARDSPRDVNAGTAKIIKTFYAQCKGKNAEQFDARTGAAVAGRGEANL